MRKELMRRLRPDQDIFRIRENPGAVAMKWGIYRVKYDNPRGELISSHDSRDEAREAKAKHEKAYDKERAAS